MSNSNTGLFNIQARLPMDMLSMKRYELPQPPAGKMTDVAAWQECVDNSQAQLEHQALRILNLEMMADYGIPAWKTYNDTLVSMIDAAQKQLQVGCFQSQCVCVVYAQKLLQVGGFILSMCVVCVPRQSQVGWFCFVSICVCVHPVTVTDRVVSFCQYVLCECLCVHTQSVTGRMVSFCQYLCESVCTQIQVGWFHSMCVCVCPDTATGRVVSFYVCCVCTLTQLQVRRFQCVCALMNSYR